MGSISINIIVHQQHGPPAGAARTFQFPVRPTHIFLRLVGRPLVINTESLCKIGQRQTPNTQLLLGKNDDLAEPEPLFLTHPR